MMGATCALPQNGCPPGVGGGRVHGRRSPWCRLRKNRDPVD